MGEFAQPRGSARKRSKSEPESLTENERFTIEHPFAALVGAPVLILVVILVLGMEKATVMPAIRALREAAAYGGAFSGYALVATFVKRQLVLRKIRAYPYLLHAHKPEHHRPLPARWRRAILYGAGSIALLLGGVLAWAGVRTRWDIFGVTIFLFPFFAIPAAGAAVTEQSARRRSRR